MFIFIFINIFLLNIVYSQDLVTDSSIFDSMIGLSLGYGTMLDLNDNNQLTEAVEIIQFAFTFDINTNTYSKNEVSYELHGVSYVTKAEIKKNDNKGELYLLSIKAKNKNCNTKCDIYNCLYAVVLTPWEKPQKSVALADCSLDLPLNF